MSKRKDSKTSRRAAGQQTDGSFDISDVPVDDDTIREIEETVVASDEAIELIEQLQAERDAAIEARQRALADLVNFRRRADENIVRARHDGIVAVLRSLLPALDYVDLALGHEEAEITVEQLMAGVRMVRDEFAKTLEGHVVRVIRPDIGDEFDPNWHQAMMREHTDAVEPGAIAAVHQIGYAIGDTMLRAASVSVAAPVEEAGAKD